MAESFDVAEAQEDRFLICLIMLTFLLPPFDSVRGLRVHLHPVLTAVLSVYMLSRGNLWLPFCNLK